MNRLAAFVLSLLCLFSLLPSAALAEVEMIVPEEYEKTGTLPVYRATERDFSRSLKPELFNQSAAVNRVDGAKHHDGFIEFADGGRLEWAEEALYYHTYDGFAEVTYETENGKPVQSTVRRPSLTQGASRLALRMLSGWPETQETYSLTKASLSTLSLAEAQETAENLLAALGLTGYKCETALDMSAERIRQMGEKWNVQFPPRSLMNQIPLDFSAATAENEGYYLRYFRYGPDGSEAGFFRASLYVTAQGVQDCDIVDRFEAGEIYDTPNALIDAKAALDALPRALAAARSPLQIGAVLSARLTYHPMRAEKKADGLVLSPVWIIRFTGEDEQGASDLYAAFSAIDGRLVDGNWM